MFTSLAACLLSFTALASEEAPDTFGQRGEWGVLLAREDVRGELKLDEKAASQVEDLLAKHAGDEKTLREKLDKALAAEQVARLRQLGWQAAEGYALLDDLVAKELKFTAKQRAALAEARAQNAAEHAEMKDFLARARFRSAEAMQAYIEEHRASASGRLLAVLTEEQERKLKKLCGEPFEFAKA
jgi:hypothetical protein